MRKQHLATCAVVALLISGCGDAERPQTIVVASEGEVAVPQQEAEQTDGDAPGDQGAATQEDLVDPPTVATLDASVTSDRASLIAVVRGDAVREPVEETKASDPSEPTQDGPSQDDDDDTQPTKTGSIVEAAPTRRPSQPTKRVKVLAIKTSSTSKGAVPASVDPPSLVLSAGSSEPGSSTSASKGAVPASVDPPSLVLSAGSSEPGSSTSTSKGAVPASVDPPSLVLSAGSSEPASSSTKKPLGPRIGIKRLVPRRPGETVASYDLGSDAPKQSFGLAYRGDVKPARLLVSDYAKSRVEVFSVGSSLTHKKTLDTAALDARFVKPRGLAFRSAHGVPYLFALTSNEESGEQTTRLWRVNLKTNAVLNANLSRSGLGIGARKAFGLAIRGTTVYVSYDSSNFKTERLQVRKGVVRLRVSFPQPRSIATPVLTVQPKLKQTPTVLQARPVLAVTLLRHIPNSGRSTSGSTYTRAPAFGLAASAGQDGDLLWGTSYNKYIYVAEGSRGRGIFRFDSPGAKKIYGLASGGGYLWAVDRPGNYEATIHKIAIAKGSKLSQQSGARTVRHLRLIVKSKAKKGMSQAGAYHNFGRVHHTSRRPSQGRDASSYVMTHNRPAQVKVKSYDPAGDSGSRQYYSQVAFSGSAGKNQTFTSTLDVDMWTSSRRQFVYPERCDSSSPPNSGYLADDSTVYQLSQTAAFNGFVTRVENSIAAEYGSQVNSNNPYWRARNIVEYVVEHYTYGNVSDSSVGHYSYMPSSFKVALPFDGIKGNEKMSCSSSTFSLVATLRLLGVPARWVGTTKFRNTGKANGVEVDDYDLNENDLLDEGETSLDTSFHRWAEVWMGARYGWQRFDPTPSSDGPREHSQFELMGKSAQGVGTRDLVLTVGSGYQQPFYDPKDHNQRYNSVATYSSPGNWSTLDERRILWTNACFLKVKSSPSVIERSSKVRVRWTTRGRWDLDPNSKVSIYAKNADGELTKLSSGHPWNAGSALVDVSDLDIARYRFVVRKDGDSLTGGEGTEFALISLEAGRG